MLRAYCPNLYTVDEGQIEVLHGVSPEDCLASVIDNPEAKGFSFYDVYHTICVIFGKLEGEVECSHECTSFKMPSENNNCVCSKQEGTFIFLRMTTKLRLSTVPLILVLATMFLICRSRVEIWSKNTNSKRFMGPFRVKLHLLKIA